MTIELNHTIVRARHKHTAARFLADVLNLPVGEQNGPFVPITLANGISLDYMDAPEPAPQHYAFLVDDEAFDAALSRIRTAGIEFHALPGREQPGQINNRWGGRGVYFHDPNGHSMELLTRSTGSNLPPGTVRHTR